MKLLDGITPVVFAAFSIVSAQALDPQSWMSGIDPSKYISEISIPGSHDTGSTSGGSLYADQTLSVADQLNKGVRFFDIRLAFYTLMGPRGIPLSRPYLRTAHGPQLPVYGAAFHEVVTDCYTFLAAHPSETIIMSVKQENSVSTASFEAAVYAEISANPSSYWLNDYIPRLSAVRGVKVGPSLQRRAKIVLIRRFPHNTASVPLPFGMDATGWVDNATFNIRNMFVEDVYSNPGEFAKLTLIEEKLQYAAITYGDPHYDPTDGRFHPRDIRIFITFTSAYGNVFDSHPIADYSDTINPALQNSILPAYTNARLGIVAMDFVTQDLAMAVIKTNAFL